MIYVFQIYSVSTRILQKQTDPRDLREEGRDEWTGVICVVKRRIPIPDVCPPLLNVSMSQILMKPNSSIIDSSCSSVPRIIIIFKEEICAVKIRECNKVMNSLLCASGWWG